MWKTTVTLWLHVWFIFCGVEIENWETQTHCAPIRVEWSKCFRASCCIWSAAVFLLGLWHELLFLFPTVNPCCYFPCQHWGVCVRYGEYQYECDCTRTGFYGENCTVRESSSAHHTSHILFYIAHLRNLKYSCSGFCLAQQREGVMKVFYLVVKWGNCPG